MKKILLTFIFISIISIVQASSIGIGFPTKDIATWRYLERTQTGYEFKILIINISDSIVNVDIKLKERLYRKSKPDTTLIKTIADNIRIENLKHTIITVDKELYENIENSTDRHLSYYVNGKSAGVTNIRFQIPPTELDAYKYLSTSGINSSSDHFWIARNTLFSLENQADSVLLYLENDEKPIIEDQKEIRISLHPSFNFLEFTIITNGMQKGEFNNYGKFIIEIPSSSEVIPNTTTKILINYTAVKKEKLFLGLTSRYQIKRYRPLYHKGYFDDTGLNGVMTIPILVE